MMRPYKFPLICLTPSSGPNATPGIEEVEWHRQPPFLNIMSQPELKRGEEVGWLIIDANLRVWRIAELKDLGRMKNTGWVDWLWWALGHGHHRYVRPELVEQPPMSWEAVKARVCASIQANPDYWRDDEAIAGEVAPPRDEQEMLDELTERCRQATSMGMLIERLEIGHEWRDHEVAGLPFEFPVLSLETDPEDPSGHSVEDVWWFDNGRQLVQQSRGRLQRFRRSRPLLIDASLKPKRVVGLTDVTTYSNVWIVMLCALFRCRRELKLNLGEEPPMTFETVKERVAAAIQAHPERWLGKQAILNAYGPFDDDEQGLAECARLRSAEMMAACRGAANFRQLFDRVVSYS
jgi:hypothetical protein